VTTGLRAALLLSVSVFAGACAGPAAEASRGDLCSPTDTAVNDGHGGPFHELYPREKGSLDSSDCSELLSLLREAESFAGQFPTVAEVTAAGWVERAVYIEGQGVHFEAPGGTQGPFDPRRPRFLLYDGSELESRLAGMMFLETGDVPPAGFPGGNDHWHNHPHLCYSQARDFVLGEHLGEAQCAAAGGVVVDASRLWMVHVWLPEYGGHEIADVFNRSHPLL